MSFRPRKFKLRRVVPVQLLLYVLLRAVLMVARMFPASAAVRGGRWIGRLLRLIDPTHRRVAVKNLERSRGVCAPDEIPEFVDRVYGNIGRTFVEMMMIPKLIDQLASLVRLERFHVVDEVRRRGKGMITVIGHLGNWELIGLAVCAAGHPLHSLARPIENPWVDRYLHRFRTQTGQRIISKYEALGEMIRVIRGNEILIIQVDQDARKHGIYVDFFGRPAYTMTLAAKLAERDNVACYLAFAKRLPRGEGYSITVRKLPEARAGESATRRMNRALEELIAECPEQYLWGYNRYKIPAGAEAPPK